MKQSILVTGGAGYIGSHTTLALLEAGYEVIVLDNLSNSCLESLRRVERICGKAATFIEGDIRDRQLLDSIFARHSIQAVLHFAGLKESVKACNSRWPIMRITSVAALCCFKPWL